MIIIKTVLGFLAYYLFPRKKLIFILGPMRSGTTLLKALLANADNIAHLPEIQYRLFKKSNRFQLYFEYFKLSKKRYLIIKKPPFTDNPSALKEDDSYIFSTHLPFRKDFVSMKFIILYRDPIEVCSSIINMTEKSPRHYNHVWNEVEALTYWTKTYEAIERFRQKRPQLCICVNYHQLLYSTHSTLKELFSKLELPDPIISDEYRTLDNGDWQWGSDDGGSKIKTLKVNREERNIHEDERIRLEEAIEANKEAQAVILRFK